MSDAGHVAGAKIAAVVAMDAARVIGLRGALPWRLAEDMAHFRQLTTDHVVVMGRKTWDSLPAKFKPLPERINVVVSRRAAELALPEGVLSAASPEEGLRVAKQVSDGKTVWVIGGEQLYSALLPYCHEVHLTVVDGEHEGDAWLPEFEAAFRHVSERPGQGCVFHVFANPSPKTL